MKQYRIETHSHSCYSFDCNTTISSIVSRCLQKKINFIIVNDHDRCEISEDDINLFKGNGIVVLKAIEFTTSEGVHLIGVHPDIKSLQRDAYYYSAIDLVRILIQLDSYVIAPHPEHATGILGNENISEEERCEILAKSHFIEIGNFKYGAMGDSDFSIKYPNLRFVIGSDAHSASSIGAFLNEFTSSEIVYNPIEALYKSTSIKLLYLQKHNCGYWLLKRLKRTCVYQFLLNLFSPELRLKIKKIIFKG